MINENDLTNTIRNDLMGQAGKPPAPPSLYLTAMETQQSYQREMDKADSDEIRCDELMRLISLGANVNYQGKYSRESAAHIAARNNDTALMQLLIEKEANLNLTTRYRQRTPVFYSNNQAMIEMMIAGGADPDVVDKKGIHLMEEKHYVMRDHINNALIAGDLDNPWVSKILTREQMAQAQKLSVLADFIQGQMTHLETRLKGKHEYNKKYIRFKNLKEETENYLRLTTSDIEAPIDSLFKHTETVCAVHRHNKLDRIRGGLFFKKKTQSTKAYEDFGVSIGYRPQGG